MSRRNTPRLSSAVAFDIPMDLIVTEGGALALTVPSMTIACLNVSLGLNLAVPLRSRERPEGGDTASYALAHSTQINGGKDTLISLNDGSNILLKGVSSINHDFFS